MLTLIRIRNYAIIDEIEVEFANGFNVMTGETGAGKSILVDALGLALGDRADATVVRPGADRAEITVLFDCDPEHPAMRWLEEHGLDADRLCSLRRIVMTEGRSRAFVNNQPVTLQDLRSLGSLLLDIHGQNAHQSLLRTATQRSLLDSSGGLGPLVAECTAAHRSWQSVKQRLEKHRAGANDRESQLALLSYKLKELAEIGLAEGEVEELRAEQKRLANVDRLAQLVQGSLDWLYEGDTVSAHTLITHASEALAELKDLDDTLEPQANQITAAEIEIRDIATALSRYRDSLEPDPERLDYVDTRLGKVRALARRHEVEEKRLFAVEEQLRNRMEALENGVQKLDDLEAKLTAAETDYLRAADKLSVARKKHAGKLEKIVTQQIRQLGLPDGDFKIEITARPSERYDANGTDEIGFLVSLNPGHPLGPLSRVASGGELSRISLALAVVDVEDVSIPTCVFDEVDAGIGGGVAEIVGQCLQGLSHRHQVLCVTHLPQVASQADHHFRITKLSDGRTSRTSIRHLSDEERIDELSRMLGGVEVTQRTRDHAAEMIERSAKSRAQPRSAR